MVRRALIAVLCAAPALAREWTLGLEVSGGGGLPIHNFLDGTEWDLVSNVPSPKGPVDIPGRFDAENRFGFNASAAFLLRKFEFRAMFAQLPWKEAKITHIGLPTLGAQGLPDGYVYFPLRAGAADPENLTEEKPLRFWAFTAGYRFYILFEHKIRPFIPLAAGPAIAMLSDMRWTFPDLCFEGVCGTPDEVSIEKETLLGFSLQTGLGVDFELAENVDLGARFRYSANFFKKPDLAKLDEGAATEIASTGDSALEAVMESVHLLSFDLAVQVGFN